MVPGQRAVVVAHPPPGQSLGRPPSRARRRARRDQVVQLVGIGGQVEQRSEAGHRGRRRTARTWRRGPRPRRGSSGPWARQSSRSARPGGGVGEVPAPVGLVPPVLGPPPAPEPSPVMKGWSPKPSAWRGTSMPSHRQMVGSTSTDSVKASTTPTPSPVGRRVGVADDQRDVKGLVPVAELLDQPVVAAHLTVVAGHHHQGRVRKTGRVEMVEEEAEPVVDLFLGPVVGGPELAALALVLRGGRRAGGERTTRLSGWAAASSALVGAATKGGRSSAS